MKQIKYAGRLFINYLKKIIYSILTANKIHLGKYPIISIKAKFRIEKNGTIKLFGLNIIEDNTLVHSVGGKIAIDNSFINRNCNIVSMKEITISKNVTIGPNVCIYDHDHNLKKKYNGDNAFVCKPIVIEENVWIGANVTILKGVSIHKNAVIAAGATVVKDVQENTIVGGVPAVKLRNIELI